MPTSSAPQTDLPPWAVGSYPAGSGSNTWDNTSRQDASTIVASAAAGLIPNLRTRAQFFNAWLSRAQGWWTFFRGEMATDKFGDGSDGAVVVVGSGNNLARDMYYTDLTVQAGGTLNPSGFRIFVSGLLTVEATGIISGNGGNASAGTAGAATSAGTLGASAAGATGIAAPNTPGNAGSPTSTSAGSSGGAGGAAGATAGGAGGTATAPTVTRGGFRHGQAALGTAHDGTLWTGGAGGGSGGVAAGTGTSGGGGGGGGVVSIWARRVSNLGTIRANGGNGGAATLGTSTSVGGGGGGGGGVVFLVHREAVGASLGTVTASGGTGGAAAGTGTAGTAGVAGRVISHVG